MYQVENMKKDVKMVKAMMEVLGEFADGREFRLIDIPEERRVGYRVDPNKRYWKFDFTGSSLKALEKRGLLTVVRKEDYICTYEDYDGRIRKKVEERNVYRSTGFTAEDYRETLAKLTFSAILHA